MPTDWAGIFYFGPVPQAVCMKNMLIWTLQHEYLIFLTYTLVANAAITTHIHNISRSRLFLYQLYFVAKGRLTAADE